MAACQMLIRIADACAETGDKFSQLCNVLQLRTTTCEDNTTVQAFVKINLLQVIDYVIEYLLHACLYDVCEVLYRYFLWRQPPEAGYGDVGIAVRLFGEGCAELHLH